MAIGRFNDPQRYLIERWQDVDDIQTCLDEINKKHNELIDKIVEEIKDRYPDLNSNALVPTRGSPVRKIAFGKKTWTGKYPYISGFWVDNIGLDSLLNPNSDEKPEASIWFNLDGNAIQKGNACIKAVRTSTSRILDSSERKLWKEDYPGYKGLALWYALPEKSTDFRKMLLDGSGQQFIECMENHFKSMFRFTETIDNAMKRG